jgi:hypothetical protein
MARGIDNVSLGDTSEAAFHGFTRTLCQTLMTDVADGSSNELELPTTIQLF